MEDIYKELKLDEMTEADKQSLVIQITDSLIKRLMLRIYDKLKPEDRSEFDKLAESNDSKKVDAFLKLKVPDFDEIREEELEGLIKEMKDFVSMAKKA